MEIPRIPWYIKRRARILKRIIFNKTATDGEKVAAWFGADRDTFLGRRRAEQLLRNNPNLIEEGGEIVRRNVARKKEENSWVHGLRLPK